MLTVRVLLCYEEYGPGQTMITGISVSPIRRNLTCSNLLHYENKSRIESVQGSTTLYGRLHVYLYTVGAPHIKARSHPTYVYSHLFGPFFHCTFLTFMFVNQNIPLFMP